MLRSTEIGAVLVGALWALAGCESADNAGSSADNQGRVRLHAQNADARFGAYSVYVNAMLTAELTPEIAANYGLVRSENQGLVNLVILKDAPGADAAMPVAGDVKLSAANLTGQVKNIKLQKIISGPSIYYIGQVAVDHRETINFDFDVRPEGSSRLLQLRYTHEFYTR